jgi:shikimate kinase
VVVDYVSKWVEALPCKNADNVSSKRMFEEIIFSRFRVPRIVISDGGSHFIDKRFKQYLSKQGILIMLLVLTTLRQVARQRHQTNKSRIFCKRQ